MLSKQLLCNFIFSISLFVPVPDSNKEAGEVSAYPKDPCESVKISVELSPMAGALSKAEIVVKGGKSPIRYFFSDNKGEMINQDYKNASLENLKPGKYTCMVKDAGNCRKLIEFEIK